MTDLAQHIRLQLHNREKNPMMWRWMVLYPLYVLAELSLVATDLSELLGSAIALNLWVHPSVDYRSDEITQDIPIYAALGRCLSYRARCFDYSSNVQS